MQIFRVVIAIAWLLVAWISVHAVATLGVNQAGAIFFADFHQPWRAQFNGDFAVHLLLMAGWTVYREKNLLRGFAFGLAAILFGGFFSLAYIFFATFAANGSFKNLLLGYKAA
jgi:hypothetical protein